MSRNRQVKCGLTVLISFICLLVVGAATASAARTYSSTVKEGFNGANTVAFEANNDFWVSDGGHQVPNQTDKSSNGIYKIDAFPSQTLLATPNTFVPWEYFSLALSVGVDQSNGEVFVSQSNGRTVDIFAPTSATNHCEEGEPVCYTHSWTGINGVTNCCGGDMHIAVDNSNGYSRGRIYLSISAPENNIEAFDSGERPIDFPATANYIKGNTLLGTPSGAFGQVEHVSVDTNGNLYATDAGKGIVDEFDSTGTFIRSFPDPDASGGWSGAGGVGIDPTNGNLDITGGYSNPVTEYDSSGNLLGTISEGGVPPSHLQTQGVPAVNSQGYLYVPTYGGVQIFNSDPSVANVTYSPVSDPTTTSGTLNARVDPNGGGNISKCQFEYGITTSYSGGTLPCAPAVPYSNPESVTASLSGLTPETTYHYRVVVEDGNGTKYGEDQTYVPSQVLGLTTDPPTSVGEASATINGSFVGNGEDTHYYFEWGPTEAYGTKTAASVITGADAPGPSRSTLSAELTGVSPYSTYHYRIVASNGAGTSHGADRMVTTTPGVPSGRNPGVTAVHSDRAELHGEIDPNGASASARFEYVNAADFSESGWAKAKTAPEAEIAVGMGKQYQGLNAFVDGLEAGTLYHYRIEGTNSTGSGGAESTFSTFPFTPSVNDPCPNAHVRQQTGASLLLDCRGYELVSAQDTGGYDVESSLVEGQTPFSGYPEAHLPSQNPNEEPQPEVLYGVHDGGIAGTGNPTNRGVDPYVATRSETGWSTRYVGIPADNQYAKSPFSSTLAEASADLQTLAFGGPEICSPCFPDGSTGSPIHRPNGQLVQGMAGSIPQSAAKSEGFIGKHLSADGTHFIFGSKSKFEPDANEGEISIYDRNLKNEETHVVSKTTTGQTMEEEGKEIGELDISKDGSRIVIGHLVGEEGNAKYWHLYMNVGDSGKTIDLTPGTTHGVLFDGMTEDGSRVFFSTVDHLTGQEAEHSGADIFEAEVSGGNTATLHLISKGPEETPGAPGDTVSCDPSANTKHEHWNTTGSEDNCGVLPIGGGGGVASGNGTVYFLSPEKLVGPTAGVQNAPNLYVARPGQAPRFVATLESSSNSPLPPDAHPFIREFGHFGHVAGTAIDHATGDIYVFDISVESSTGYVYKFDPAGHPVLAFGENGRLSVSGLSGFYNLPCGISVDNDPSSPNYGDLYVPALTEEAVNRYSPSGVHEATIGGIESASATAVDPNSGDLYVTGFGGTVYIYGTNGSLIKKFGTESEGATGLAVNSSGRIYVVNGGGFGAKGSTQIYSSLGTHEGQLDGNPSYAVAVDSSDSHVYVDEGNQVTEFDASGNPVGAPTGSGLLSKSFGVSADSGSLAIGDPGRTNVATYGPAFVPSDPSTDNPVVVDSVSEPGSRKTADFEVTPSGGYAVFTSTLPLTGYNNAAKPEIFRYGAQGEELDCVSCNSTGEEATVESSLASNGLSLTNDGRVFFNSGEGLVDRDLNGKIDVYEWEANGFLAEYDHKSLPEGTRCRERSGCIQLVSTGTALLGSSLLGVSAEGTDAFFFTRDTLVSADRNGNRVKIYDARTAGGFPEVPAPIPCKASDECHGPGSQAPQEPDIKTIAHTPNGNGEATSETRCGKRFVKKHGTCVRRAHHRRRRHKGGRRG
jgi:hypothetical protein